MIITPGEKKNVSGEHKRVQIINQNKRNDGQCMVYDEEDNSTRVELVGGQSKFVSMDAFVSFVVNVGNTDLDVNGK